MTDAGNKYLSCIQVSHKVRIVLTMVRTIAKDSDAYRTVMKKAVQSLSSIWVYTIYIYIYVYIQITSRDTQSGTHIQIINMCVHELHVLLSKNGRCTHKPIQLIYICINIVYDLYIDTYTHRIQSIYICILFVYRLYMHRTDFG